jgi:hypothetical protein
MTRPSQKDDLPSSDSDVIILDDKNQPAYTVRTSRNRALVMPTVLEEGESMGSAEAPAADYLNALARDGGVSPIFFSSIEDLTVSDGHTNHTADADADPIIISIIAQQNSTKI